MPEGENNNDENDRLMGENDPDGAPEGEFQETRKFCFCFNLKCGISFFGIFLILDFLFEIINVVFIAENDNFDKLFAIVYGLLLIFEVLAITAVLYYWVSEESHNARKQLPWAAILAAVGSFAILTWIIIYIAAIYPYKKVYVNNWDRETEPDLDVNDEEKRNSSTKYTKQTKVVYILSHILVPLLNGIAFLLFYFPIKGWVERHKKQDKTYG